mmetsp:Transcript_164380/g.522671  ORF Transcript_164380/g.522671 Transcript_164380/m.522671 type:complete len:374 (-) Transcript_164380:598-1719(-)
MAVERSSCFKPAVHQQQTIRWKVEGYSWIKSKKPSELFDSPELFGIGDLSVGIRCYPGGRTQEDSDWSSVFLLIFKGSGTFEVEFSLKMLSLNPDTPDISRRGTGRIVGGKFFSETAQSCLWGWTKFASREQAESCCKDDMIVFELCLSLWSDQTVARHTGNTVALGNSDRTQLVADFAKLLQCSEYTDVALLPSGKNRGDALRAHRIVLAARSPVFKQMFFGAGVMQEAAANSEVQMIDVDHEVATYFVRALYSDEIHEDAWDDDEILCRLLKAFHRYQVDHLVKRCEARIITMLSQGVVAERLMMADLLDLLVLRKAALDFMTRSQSQLAAVQATKGFQRLVEQRPKILAEILAKMSPPAPCEEGQSMGSR